MMFRSWYTTFEIKSKNYITTYAKTIGKVCKKVIHSIQNKSVTSVHTKCHLICFLVLRTLHFKSNLSVLFFLLKLTTVFSLDFLGSFFLGLGFIFYPSANSTRLVLSSPFCLSFRLSVRLSMDLVRAISPQPLAVGMGPM